MSSRELLTMLDQFVQAAIEIIFVCQTEILVQQIGHGAVGKPVTVQTPFTSGINEAVDG